MIQDKGLLILNDFWTNGCSFEMIWDKVCSVKIILEKGLLIDCDVWCSPVIAVSVRSDLMDILRKGT